jgi:sirohydrochlorin cobaltochelatase
MNNAAQRHALLLFAHGSSDPGWADPFLKLQSNIQQRDPTQIVRLAFLERMQPSFDDAVDALHAGGIKQVTVAPIFLALGGHMKKDLPELIVAAKARTGIEFRVLPALGEVDELIDSMANWVNQASRAP